MTLPAALAGLAAYDQFVIYRTAPKPDNPARLDKFPIDWRTGRVCNALDPANWTSYAVAALTAELWGAGYGVAFVLTDNDPFWCIDVDNCLTGGVWSHEIQELAAALPGCAIERSVSGTGAHIFGSGTPPAHSCAPSATLGFYHTQRFIALGGLPGAVGDVNTDATPMLPAVVARWFPPGVAITPAAWTTQPRSDWRGSIEDADLLRRAHAVSSAGATFGGRASFTDLWEANATALGVSYPANDGRPYDGSSADAALAQHLAFWTGHDCERIKRLMLASALNRSKWERDDYLPRTILAACAVGVTVCQDKLVEPPPESATPTRVEGGRIVGLDQQAEFFAGYAYVMDVDSIFSPRGELLNRSRFDAMLGGYTFVIDGANGALSKKPWEVFTASQGMNFPKVGSLEFDPTRPAGDIWTRDGTRFLNSYVPIATPISHADVAPFKQHLIKLFPHLTDRTIIESYMAAIVQYPGVKFQWAPLIQGAPGNGKSLLARCIIEALGRRYCHPPKPAELASRFNAFLDNRLFINVEDIYHNGSSADIIEALNAMITSDWLELEGKGTEKRMRRICANFMINSNHTDGVRKARWDRRYSMFFTPHQSKEDIDADGMGGAYFPTLYAWLKQGGYAAVHGWLKTYPIPDEFNPATNCQRSPVTSSTERAIEMSSTPLEQEIRHAIESETQGLRGGWASSYYIDQIITRCGCERSVPRNARRKLMQDMGFVLHPGLIDGRVNNPVMPEGIKSRLYVRPDHLSLNLKGVEVSAAYTRDQTP